MFADNLQFAEVKDVDAEEEGVYDCSLVTAAVIQLTPKTVVSCEGATESVQGTRDTDLCDYGILTSHMTNDRSTHVFTFNDAASEGDVIDDSTQGCCVSTIRDGENDDNTSNDDYVRLEVLSCSANRTSVPSANGDHVVTSLTVDFSNLAPRSVCVSSRTVSTRTRKSNAGGTYSVKITDQRKLSKEQPSKKERQQAQEEREDLQRCEVEGQVARDGDVEEEHLVAESCQANESARPERKAQEIAAQNRQFLEAIHRDCSEVLRKAKEERAMRKKRLAETITRINRNDSFFSRSVANLDSSNSLSGMMTASATKAGGDQARTEGDVKKPSVRFSLGSNPTTSVPNENRLCMGYPICTSTPRQPLLAGRNRFCGDSLVSTAALSTPTGDVPSVTRLPDGSP
uniref:Ig-like domain-containing protein n=1 Tax=Mesocestoides corti TaxID=53468 RepID=A0A5K3F3T5_MESCO